MSPFGCTSAAFVEGSMRVEVGSDDAGRYLNYPGSTSIYGSQLPIIMDEQGLATHLGRLQILIQRLQ